MLVLSRQPNEKILFPNLGISVQVLRVAGNRVRIGVDAPRDVEILREEVAKAAGSGPQAKAAADRLGKLTHEQRNRLNTAMLGMNLLKRHIGRGDLINTEKVLGNILNELQQLDGEATGTPARKKPDAERLYRTLIVEDNENEARLLSGFLRTFNFEVQRAPHGAAALKVLDEQPDPDCVLLDMRMPKLDGPSTIREIRSRPEHHDLKVFAISGTNPGELGVTEGPEGVNRWFRKPLDPEKLVRELRQDMADSVAG